MLGRRPCPPIKRTTSMTEITFDLNTSCDITPPAAGGSGGGIDGLDQWLSATVSPRNQRRSSANFSESAHFLRSCFLCNRRLVPGRDIYMYRGDSAFCSLECRQQQMSQDERKDKCSLPSKNQIVKPTTTGSQVAPRGETVPAL
ncbi:Protein of unknown function (DUF581) [Quillaja saponaria]|uniref:FLZ-type domain-containing protein n=1 Tax=Quillaja saponaria TaxID=32244 RepID=A0AAD7LWL8_QUISA|nr:Protein of unknown function (DUF581) [Quillaja saponaria]